MNAKDIGGFEQKHAPTIVEITSNSGSHQNISKQHSVGVSNLGKREQRTAEVVDPVIEVQLQADSKLKR